MMMRFLLILVLGGITGTAWTGAAAEDVRRDAAVEAVQKVIPSVVNIATEEVVPVRDTLDNLFREFFDPYYRQRPPNMQYSLGSGVIVDQDGYVLTNFHVVSRARRVWVKLHDGREFEAEKISGTSVTDLALLKIKSQEKDWGPFTPAAFADDDDLLLGETVLALGNPFGLGISVSRGILSSKSRRPPLEGEVLDVMDWLQTDAAINPGNSGGPLVDLRGDLIGINVAIAREGQGIGFAIPVKRVTEAISEMYSPEAMKNLWFGARVRPGRTPLLVTSVQVESPAGQAGLRAGDRILDVNGEAPTGFIDFNRRLFSAGETKKVALQVKRGEETRTIRFQMIPESAFFNEGLIRKKTGASVQKLTPELARAFGLGRLSGLMVAGVDRGSAADAVHLDKGMVITGVAGQSTTDVMDAAKILYGKGKGDKVVLDVIVPRQRGPFYTIEQVAVELTLQ
jgi:serine protease Do